MLLIIFFFFLEVNEVRLMNDPREVQQISAANDYITIDWK